MTRNNSITKQQLGYCSLLQLESSRRYHNVVKQHQLGQSGTQNTDSYNISIADLNLSSILQPYYQIADLML